jgi:hypothetical protein
MPCPRAAGGEIGGGGAASGSAASEALVPEKRAAARVGRETFSREEAQCPLRHTEAGLAQGTGSDAGRGGG